MTSFALIAELVFAWSFSVALILAAVDWIRPFSISPFFNVGWLILLAAIAIVGKALLPRSAQEDSKRPPWIMALAVFLFAAAATRSLGWLAALALGALTVVVLWALVVEE